ncbi:Os07g0151650 [Oryza sativa Japonica Group]|uniref:Os07g0151650 protein n=1 Tax=Oryza sativa subsp. japonica TaxID=39947 RepID=A0A0P0X2A4_ORYSJ|nr:Os07g0151650 [Oryza sativa Japonica Group]
MQRDRRCIKVCTVPSAGCIRYSSLSAVETCPLSLDGMLPVCAAHCFCSQESTSSTPLSYSYRWDLTRIRKNKAATYGVYSWSTSPFYYLRPKISAAVKIHV